jgi:Fur family ferric uptake transcriptional regulator
MLDRLRERGWRLTPQRRVVVQALDQGDHVPLTAEAVHAVASEVLPEISLATTYNTLNELVAMGELLEVTAAGGAKRYDPNGRAHQHLICTRCGEIRDVVPTGASELDLAEDERHGYELQNVEIVFRGRCPRCQTAEAPPSRPH